MRYNYIAIEGNIGAGKTTLATKLSDDWNARLVLESFSNNPFLPRFYAEPERYAFPLELFFLAERHQQLKNIFNKADLFHDGVIADYMFVKSLLFASANLNADERMLFYRLYNMLKSHLPQPELVLYLHLPVNLLLRNIEKRGREYEKRIHADYLLKIQQAYLDYFRKQTELRVVLLNTEHLDFVNDVSDYEFIKNLLTSHYDRGTHFIGFEHSIE